MNHHLLSKYFIATFSYGFLRSIPRLSDKKEKYYDGESREDRIRPLLITEKAANCILMTFSAATLWPFFVYRDLRLMEVLATNKNLSHYGINEDWD